MMRAGRLVVLCAMVIALGPALACAEGEPTGLEKTMAMSEEELAQLPADELAAVARQVAEGIEATARTGIDMQAKLEEARTRALEEDEVIRDLNSQMERIRREIEERLDEVESVRALSAESEKNREFLFELLNRQRMIQNVNSGKGR